MLSGGRKESRVRYLDTLAVELVDSGAGGARSALGWAAVAYSAAFL
jgi:hypothetical protein